MATAIQDRAKRVKFFQNGDRSVQKNVCINKKVIRTWDALLEELTGRLKLHGAARSIRTPVGGTRIIDIAGLEDNNEYVVVGNGPFRQAGYKDPAPAKKIGMSPRMLLEVRPVAHSKVQAPSRLILSNKVITLQAFANGKKLKPPKSMAFDEKALKSWRVILETLTDKLEMDKACVKLYTADSYALVTTPDQLEHQGKYICVGAGEKLKKHSYGREPPKFNSSKHVRKRELAPIKRSHRPHPEGGESYNTTTESSPISTSTAKTTSTKKSTPIRKSTKPKKEEDGVFHARPVKHTPSGGARLVRDDDEGGPFHAAQDREEDAAEVEESKDTRVELPIDQVEAEEVADEEIVKAETPEQESDIDEEIVDGILDETFSVSSDT